MEPYPEKTTSHTANVPRYPEITSPSKPVQQDWQGFIRAVSKKQRIISNILGKSAFKEISDGNLTFELRGTSFELSRITAKKNELEAICSDYFGRKMTLNIIDKTENTTVESNQGVSVSKIKQEAMNHPLVLHAVNLFSGNIVDVKIASQERGINNLPIL